jgi:uncharacterized membrane protein
VLIGVFLGALSCVAGDTFASELGILSTSEPFLITTFERVPRGTSGGVTSYGFAVSLLGGLVVGTVLVVDVLGLRWQLLSSFSFSQQNNLCSNDTKLFLLIFFPLIGALMGLIGSIIDSILGATVQRTWFDTKAGKVTAEFPNDAVESFEPYAPALLDTLKERDLLRAELKELKRKQGLEDESKNGLRKRNKATQGIENSTETDEKDDDLKRILVTIGGLPILSNEQVNLASSSFTAIMTGVLFYKLL